MYRIFEITSNIDGEQVRENVLITWPDGGDLFRVLHKLGLEYALSPEGLKTCRHKGVTYNEVLSRLTPEMLAPYGAQIIWLDCVAIRVEDKQIINRYALESHLEVIERDRHRERRMRDIAERYARKLDRLKAEGHPLLSEWDTGRVSARAISWAYMFVRTGAPDAGKFFDERLADAVCKAGLCCTWVNIAMKKHGQRLQLAAKHRLKQYKGKWIPANQTQNLPHIHQQYKQKIPSVKYRDIYIGFTALTFCRWEQTHSKNQAETPYTEDGRQSYFKRTKRKRMNARLDEMYPDKTARAASYGQWGKLNNFEFIMNRAYALNRDKLKCGVCGGWLISSTPWAHRINPNLPLDKVNRVNNLVSLHKKCFMAVNNPSQDISEFDVKAQKKIIGYREKLVPSHTRNNQSALMERRVVFGKMEHVQKGAKSCAGG